MALECGLTLFDGPFSMVSQGYQQTYAWAAQSLEFTFEALENLGNTPISELSFGTQLNPDTGWWDYVRPVKPERPDIDFQPDFDLISAPPSTDIGDIAFTNPPTFDTTAPLLPVRSGPDPLTATEPGDPPLLTTPVKPISPVLVIPDFPALREIVLPDVPTVTLPAFEGVRPDFSDLAAPTNTFAFTPTQYTSALLDKTRSRVSTMLDGDTGLPLAVAQALRDRAFVQQDILETRAEQQAREEYASRGHSEPSGILNRRVAQARQDAQNARAALNRDIYIQDQQVAIENLRFAVTQGIATESLMIQEHYQFAQFGLEAAKVAVQIEIDLFNTRRDLVGLQLQAYQTDAQVHRDRIQAEQAKIEVYRAELEGQKLVGEINQQDVAIYSERVRSVLAQVEIYNAQVNAFKAEIEANNSTLEGYRARILAYSERVKAWAVEWDAFKAQIESDTAQLRNYEISAEVYATRVQAWAGVNSNKIDQQRLRIAEKELDLNAWRSQIERIDAAIKAEMARLAALTNVYQADTQMYEVDGRIESIASESKERIFRLGLEQERERVMTSLENVRIRIAQLDRTTTLALEKQKSIAQIGSQLAAASMSAVNFSAGVSSSQSNSTGCSTGYNYNYEGT